MFHSFAMTLPAQSTSETEADAFLCSVLRDSRIVPPRAAATSLVPMRALHHGVTGLIASSAQALSHLPDDVSDDLKSQARARAMWELEHRQVIRLLLKELSAAGVPSVLLKGTALAYTVYASSAHRPRGDTDLLLPKSQREVVRRVLARIGFSATSDRQAERSMQEEWAFVSTSGTAHCVDLHWNLIWTWALSDLFDTARLLESSRPVPELGPHARCLPPHLALLHACVHRASHFNRAYFVGAETQYGGDRLIWFQDMHLLAATMTDEDWQGFCTEATATQTQPLCLDAMMRCMDLLGTPVPLAVQAHLAKPPENSAAVDYFVRRSMLGRLRAELASLPADASRIAFLRELLFPSPASMRAAFPELAHRPVLILYLHRFAKKLQRNRIERRQRRTSR